jgi:hypothetical protein
VQPVTRTAIDPPLGPETEAFFDAVLQDLTNVPASSVPMREDTGPACDFNGDGRCDEEDHARLVEHIGSCEGEPGYNPSADVDGNGCLTVADEEALFPPIIPVEIDIKPGGSLARSTRRARASHPSPSSVRPPSTCSTWT